MFCVKLPPTPNILRFLPSLSTGVIKNQAVLRPQVKNVGAQLLVPKVVILNFLKLKKLNFLSAKSKDDNMFALNHLDRNMPILVVDDFSTMRRIIKNCLKGLGFENVTEADDGKNAWDKIQSNDFKFIVSDWNMPNMMGIDLLRAIRASKRHSDIPFMMVTAETQKDTAIEAEKEGVSTCIIKPFTAEILQTKMETIFKKNI